MGNPPRYGGLDAFKVIAALLVVAIHTSPLTTYSPRGISSHLGKKVRKS